MPLEIVRNDITAMSVDAIVNTTNTALKMGGGVSGAIYSAAGIDKLQSECDLIGGCGVGQAVLTGGYNLKARFIIHTVGPVWRGGSFDEARQLSDCYTNSLTLAVKNKCRSVAVPLISSGIYGYPRDQALQIAVAAIAGFLVAHEIKVYLVVYDKSSFELSEKLFTGVSNFIDDNYIEEHRANLRHRTLESDELNQQNVTHFMLSSSHLDLDKDLYEEMNVPLPSKSKRRLEDIIGQLEESFSRMLIRLIDQKGLTDVETYKRANIDRKLFSKIRSDRGYKPGKGTVIALALALRLNLDETKDLLAKAGFALSDCSKFDLIVEYFIQEEIYDINVINQYLFAFEQNLLGA